MHTFSYRRHLLRHHFVFLHVRRVLLATPTKMSPAIARSLKKYLPVFFLSLRLFSVLSLRLLSLSGTLYIPPALIRLRHHGRSLESAAPQSMGIGCGDDSSWVGVCARHFDPSYVPGWTQFTYHIWYRYHFYVRQNMDRHMILTRISTAVPFWGRAT